MSLQYSKSYIDDACELGDVFTLYDIVVSLSREHQLSEPLQLFARLWDWCCMTRSGIWQYYEGIDSDFVEETAGMMERNNLHEISSRYRAGLANWQAPNYCEGLGDWIEDRWDELENIALSLVENNRDELHLNQA